MTEEKGIDRTLAEELADKIKGRARKTIHLENIGHDIVIRKLSPYDFMVEGLDVPADTLTPGEDELPSSFVQKEIERNPKAYRHFLEVIIKKGVIVPRVIDDDTEPDRDEINVADLSDDLPFIVNEIIEFSGLGESAKKFRTGDEDKEKNTSSS